MMELRAPRGGAIVRGKWIAIHGGAGGGGAQAGGGRPHPAARSCHASTTTTMRTGGDGGACVPVWVVTGGRVGDGAAAFGDGAVATADTDDVWVFDFRTVRTSTRMAPSYGYCCTAPRCCTTVLHGCTSAIVRLLLCYGVCTTHALPRCTCTTTVVCLALASMLPYR